MEPIAAGVFAVFKRSLRYVKISDFDLFGDTEVSFHGASPTTFVFCDNCDDILY